MNTLKSAALVVVLLGVLYGVYVALNKPLPPEASALTAEVAAPLVEYGEGNLSRPTTGFNSPPLTMQDASDNPAYRTVGGTYQPNIDTGSMPPPTPPTTSVPLDPSAGAAGGSLQQSTYEAPAPSASTPSPAAVAPPIPTTTAQNLAAYDLRRDLAEAEQLITAGKSKSALAKLTPYYAHTDLAPDQRAVALQWLDALAAKVIYSGEHLLASPHQVRRGETLFDVAQQYNVEYRLLQNINRREVTDPQVLVPSIELKVVPGPFRADVNLTTGEVTLLVNDLYAGRFPIALGDQPPQPGDYKVVDKKSQQKTYIGFDGRVIPANDPANPYGNYWLSLGGEVCIHGSPTVPGNKTLGCISLSPSDAEDVYGILSVGSDVKIRR